jgi:hypothetical protein
MKTKIILLILAIVAMVNANAQNMEVSKKDFKYEIAMDLKGFFSNGYPEKVLFKINNIRDNQIKGAYRFGVGAMYWIDKYKITHDNENYDLTTKKQQGNFSLSFGYEFQKQLNKAVFYYGADLGALLTIADDMDAPYTEEFQNLFFVPFAGVKVSISNNLSVAFEAGLNNFYLRWKGEGSEGNPDNRQYHSYYISELKLPYSLTFNFHF